jgi:DNA-binding transcriptional LysR family regulator
MKHLVALCYLEDYIYHIFMDMISSLFAEAGLSFDRLRAFCQVAEARGFTKAAGGDPAKQPLLSRQVKELETFFGVELLRRHGRGVIVTEAGQKLHRLTRDAFGALADFKAATRQQPQTLQIGAGDSVIQWLILPTLSSVRKKLPEVRLKFLNLPTQGIVERVESGEMEMGIVRDDAVTDRLASEKLGPMAFGFFIPKRVLAGKEKTTWQEVLAQCPLVTLEGVGSHRHVLQSAAEEDLLTLQIEVECSSFPAIAKAMASASLGGILPLAAASELPLGQFTRLKVPWIGRLERNMSLIWSPRVASMRDRVESSARTLAAIWMV